MPKKTQYEYKGQLYTYDELVDVAKGNGVVIGYNTVAYRLRRGWSVEEAVTIGKHARRGNVCKLSDHDKIMRFLADLPIDYEFTIDSLMSDLNTHLVRDKYTTSSKLMIQSEVGGCIAAIRDSLEEMGKVRVINHFTDEFGHERIYIRYKKKYRIAKKIEIR